MSLWLSFVCFYCYLLTFGPCTFPFDVPSIYEPFHFTFSHELVLMRIKEMLKFICHNENWTMNVVCIEFLCTRSVGSGVRESVTLKSISFMF